MSAEQPPPDDRSRAATNRVAAACSCQDLAVRARKKLSQHCQFHLRAETFEFLELGDTLVVRGRVPTFYLKQVAQTVLRDLDGVRWVDNQIEVIASNGLSSVRES